MLCTSPSPLESLGGSRVLAGAVAWRAPLLCAERNFTQQEKIVTGVVDTWRVYSKAVEWYQRALDDQEKALGKYYPRVLCTVRDLGLVFRDMGEYGKAQGCHDRTLDCLKILRKDHPVSFLAAAYMSRSDNLTVLFHMDMAGP